MTTNNNKIKNYLEESRAKLHLVWSQKKDMNDPEVQQAANELDRIANEYHRLTNGKFI